MPMPALSIIDIDSFPIACLEGARLAPGDGPRIIADLEALLAHGEPFVLVLDGSAPTRQPEEDKQRMLWLKEHRQRFAATCKGVISVAADAQRFALVQKQTEGLGAALGIHFFAVQGLPAAQSLARTLLAS